MSSNSQLVRDLEWVVSSPSLISQPAALAPKSATPFDRASVDIDELERFVDERKSHRVGRYFESLVLYWLERIRRVEMIADGLQIREGKQTIGELDFVFRDEVRELTHWEAAVKFYLHYPNENPTGSHLIGPNAQDTFEKKTRKLFEKQLPLSRRDFPDIVHRQAFVKGRIFYHVDSASQTSIPSNARLATDHLRSSWVQESRLEWLASFNGRAFCIVRKPFWLSPLQLQKDDEQLKSTTEMIDWIQKEWDVNRHPVLVSILELQGGDDCEWIETDRVFVVPEQWPIELTRDSV